MSKNPNLCNEFEKFGFETTIFFTKVVDFGGRSEKKNCGRFFSNQFISTVFLDLVSFFLKFKHKKNWARTQILITSCCW